LDFETLIDAKNNQRVFFNSYCIRKGLIRKAHVAFQIKKYLAKKSNSVLGKYVPNTYIFELDYLDYLDEALNEAYEVDFALRDNELKKKANKNEITKKFILKSSLTNKGAEILIFDSRKQLENYFQKRVEMSEDESIDLREWVIQDYISEPLELQSYNKRKFHLRVYVLAVGSLQVYVYENILALFSLNSYNNPAAFSDSEGQSIDMKSHITNTCFQLDNMDESSCIKQVENECVKKFWSLNFDEELNSEKNSQKQHLIFNQIKECVGELFGCLYCEPTVFQPLSNAFELYGFDFLVDKNYNCFFLEANAFPDFKQTGESLNDLIDCLFYQTISLTFDKYFDISNVCDANKMHMVFDKKR
jgi:tubulin---tyrosine ligase